MHRMFGTEGIKLAARMLVILGILGAGLALAPASAHAIVYELTSDHCTGGCGTAPFGEVELIQNGTTVDVTVTLFNGNEFVKTGAGDFQWFKFNATGVVLGEITIDPITGLTLVAATGTFNGDGTGDFGFGITCSSCANGAGAGDPGPLVFHVANAVIADLTTPNANGNVFVADIFSPETGNTGPVDATTPVPEPATLLLIGTGLAGVGAWNRRRRQHASQ